jgi:integrase
MLADMVGACAALSKSGRPRQLPLSPAAVRVLHAHADRRAPDEPYVFPGSHVAGLPLQGLRKSWERAKRAAGLAADLGIHDLHRSLASSLATAGKPLNEIGAVPGHRQLSTSTCYAHHAPERLVETATAAARAWNLLPAGGWLRGQHE